MTCTTQAMLRRLCTLSPPVVFATAFLFVVVTSKGIAWLDVYHEHLEKAQQDAVFSASCADVAWRNGIGQARSAECDRALEGSKRSPFRNAWAAAVDSLWPCYILFGTSCGGAAASAFVGLTTGSWTGLTFIIVIGYYAASLLLQWWSSPLRFSYNRMPWSGAAKQTIDPGPYAAYPIPQRVVAAPPFVAGVFGGTYPLPGYGYDGGGVYASAPAPPHRPTYRSDVYDDDYTSGSGHSRDAPPVHIQFIDDRDEHSRPGTHTRNRRRGRNR